MVHVHWKETVRRRVEGRQHSGCGFYLRSSEDMRGEMQNHVFWKCWLYKGQGPMRCLPDITRSGLYYHTMVGVALFLNWDTEDHKSPGGEAGLKVRPRAVITKVGIRTSCT